MKVYLLSGIGADDRLFTHLHLPDGFEAEYIYWNCAIPGETLEEYAYRLFIPYDTDEKFIVIGLSLGGIVATEIAKAFAPVFTVLISSVPIAKHLPPYYRFAKKLALNRLFPPVIWKVTATCKHYLMLKSQEDKRLMRAVIWEGDADFIRWGIQAVLEWDNASLPLSFCHIHGTRDEVFPIRYTTPTHIIPNGGHMLIRDGVITC